MELLLVVAVVFSVGLANCAFRQRRQLRSFAMGIRRRDEAIGRLQAQIESLQRERTRNLSLASTASDVAYDTLVLLDEELKILAANRAAERLFGRGDPVGKRLADLVDSDELHNLVQVALREDESIEEQFAIGATNFRARSLVIAPAQGRRYIAICLQDITELVNLRDYSSMPTSRNARRASNHSRRLRWRRMRCSGWRKSSSTFR